MKFAGNEIIQRQGLVQTDNKVAVCSQIPLLTVDEKVVSSQHVVTAVCRHLVIPGKKFRFTRYRVQQIDRDDQ